MVKTDTSFLALTSRRQLGVASYAQLFSVRFSPSEPVAAFLSVFEGDASLTSSRMFWTPHSDRRRASTAISSCVHVTVLTTMLNTEMLSSRPGLGLEAPRGQFLSPWPWP